VKRAVFLDRDGTVIEQVHYLADPEQVELIPGAGRAICQLAEHGYEAVIVTNQSAVGRGLITLDDVAKVHEEMLRQLAEDGASIAGIYHNPHVPKTKDRETIEHPDRKPGPGMLLRAAKELGLDVSRSWMVGDMISDILAGRNAGCLGTVLVRTGYGDNQELDHDAIDYRVDTIAQAADLIIKVDNQAVKTKPSSVHAP